MKQVWQADDGTIFNKEEDCDRYESYAEDMKVLKGFILKNNLAKDFDTWLEITMTLAKEKKELFLRYINYLGEK